VTIAFRTSVVMVDVAVVTYTALTKTANEYLF